MLIKQMNDSMEHLEIFNELIIEIGVDRVQLNTVSRPPLEETAKGLDAEELLSGRPSHRRRVRDHRRLRPQDAVHRRADMEGSGRRDALEEVHEPRRHSTDHGCFTARCEGGALEAGS